MVNVFEYILVTNFSVTDASKSSSTASSIHDFSYKNLGSQNVHAERK